MKKSDSINHSNNNNLVYTEIQRVLKYRTITDVIKEGGFYKDKGITFINEKDDEFISYKQLFHDSLKILKLLQIRGLKPGDEVVFQIIPPKDFLRIFWACILGGFIPVPVEVRKNYEHQLKLFKIWKILKKQYLITSDEIFERLIAFSKSADLSKIMKEMKLRKIFLSELNFSSEKEGRIYKSTPEDIAYIQFSSGTTGDPKGIILTHGNLITNIKSIIKCAKFTCDDSFLSWMPLSHDMGLIGYHLVPTTIAINHYIMLTSKFLIQPIEWLKKTSDYRVTILSSPNFGYKHFLTFFNPELANEWDLSCVRLIFNGAEPISADLCNKFLDKMESFGLKKNSMYPVYGLAEATLAVSFPPPEEDIKKVTLNRNFLEIGKEIKYEEEGNVNGISFVDVGYALDGSPIRIVDNHNQVLPENTIGNIQISGKNVTKGYYKNIKATKEVITKDGWLNTGDLGFIRNNRLVVTGRAKDIIFVNGQNYYSHDIERIAEDVEGMELGKIVVVGVFNQAIHEDEIILFVLYKNEDLKPFILLAIELQKYIYSQIGLKISYVIPVLRIPKTTSGKIQRNRLRENYVNGDYNELIKKLSELIDKEFNNMHGDDLQNGFHKNCNEIVQIDEKELLVKIQRDIIKIVSKILMIKEKMIDPDIDTSEYGFNSITITAMANKINQRYNLQITPAILFEHASIGSFSRYLYKEYSDCFIKYYYKGVNISSLNLEEQRIEVLNKKCNIEIAEDQTSDEINYRQNNNIYKEQIAIIGMSGIMPQSDDLEIFWKFLEDGKDLITVIPEERWDWRNYFGDPTTEANKTNIKWGGFMKEVDKFDPVFFGISPREAELMDPQQRIFLETVWKTIEDAGYKASDLSGTRTALFVGVATADYNEILRDHCIEIEAQTSTGMSHSMIANRISYLFNLHGPSEAIDTACSSSLVAVHRGVEAIRNGNCEMAIAGGVNVILSPTLYISFSKAGMLSEEGRCKTFDKDANGYVRSEGVGAILLKPLNKAKRDRDHIYAVIRGTSENHGGHTNSLTAPNPNAQADLIIRSYESTETDPSTVTYIETHGTGTSLGDPIEINGLKRAFDELFKKSGKLSPKKAYCGIGSVKTNVGHLETAAGIASVLKILLAMKYKKLPANIHFKELNPYIQIDDSPFYIVKKTKMWECLRDENNIIIPRRAGVSSFGFGGSNAHIIIEEYNDILSVRDSKILSPQIFVFSAKSEERLKIYVKDMMNFFEKEKIKDKLLMHANIKEDYIQLIQKQLKKLIIDIIEVSEKDINLHDNISEYGFDQNNIGKFLKQINELYNFEIKTLEFLECMTIYSISNFIYSEYKENIENYYEKLIGDDIEYLTFVNIAYTLQVGREAMDYRLAIIAEDINTLLEGLETFSRHTGTCSNNSWIFVNHLSRVGSNGVKESQINIAVENHDLTTIAKLWIKGMKIPWRKLYPDVTVQRISLPTYPFERKRCWIQNKNIGYINRNNNYKENLISDIVSHLDKKYKSKEEIEELIIQKIAFILHYDEDEIDLRTDLSEYGLTSFNGLQLVNFLHDHMIDTITLKEIFQYPTIELLVNYIIEQNNLTNAKVIQVQKENKEAINKISTSNSSSTKVKKVLLTGATGVLGGHLIKDILEMTDSEIYCLVRANNIEHAEERIRTFLSVYDPEQKLISEFKKRIYPIVGDITQPTFGLQEKIYNDLADTIDMTIHAAASTSLYGLYDQLKAVNVDGTSNVKDFALRTKQKYLVYISSYAVIGDREYRLCEPFTEKDFDLGQGFEYLGYAKTKFEAEKIIRNAKEEGLKWIIFRPGNIFGDSHNGYYPIGLTGVTGIFYDLIRTVIEMQYVVNSSIFFDITPVNYVSQGIVHLSMLPNNYYETFHLLNPDHKRFYDIIYLLKEFGYYIDLISVKEYMERISCHNDKEHEYSSLTTELIRYNPQLLLSTENSYIDASYTKKILEKHNIICPNIDNNLINTYLNYCIKIGYLPQINNKTLEFIQFPTVKK